MNKEKVLILGKTPLPIGGVTVHVDRLLFHLKQNNILFDFVELIPSNFFSILKFFFAAKSVHLHTSNVYIRFIFSFLCKCFSKRFDYTLHGDLNRYKSKFKNYLDFLTIKFSYRPILLNSKSYFKALSINSNAELISSFLPPNLDNEVLDYQIFSTIVDLKARFFRVFCTNAFNLAYDKDSVEIYGIFDLIDSFVVLPDFLLVVSDPSGAYSRYINENNIAIGNNVYFISVPHSFYRVIELSDVCIRNTSTDGDSLSVKESLYLNKFTFCTDVVSRPVGCILYSRGSFLELVIGFDFTNRIRVDTTKLFEIQKIIQIYTI
ncbi:hypothetical protein GCM10009119_43220 [Algoriphagus jejuensis]|uniref:Glycosyltransferase involved in cell wall biosynthesis n=1 Tax=Algoriphagus jejuensis TaxID=419934 RepID=A0ABP3YML0_9BACT